MATTDLLYKIAQIVRDYYDRRGGGLEKTCIDIINTFNDNSSPCEITKGSNVFALSEFNIKSILFRSNDWLMAVKDGRVSYYTAKAVGPNTVLAEATWSPNNDWFSNPQTTESLIQNGFLLWVVRDY